MSRQRRAARNQRPWSRLRNSPRVTGSSSCGEIPTSRVPSLAVVSTMSITVAYIESCMTPSRCGVRRPTGTTSVWKPGGVYSHSYHTHLTHGYSPLRPQTCRVCAYPPSVFKLSREFGGNSHFFLIYDRMVGFGKVGMGFITPSFDFPQVTLYLEFQSI